MKRVQGSYESQEIFSRASTAIFPYTSARMRNVQILAMHHAFDLPLISEILECRPLMIQHDGHLTVLCCYVPSKLWHIIMQETISS